ncbi:MAG: C_GCAxxG_C_C family protein [Clostridia bacterium]|nr:C_GCAxxG_C_C family protein [Clostridia bacterium]
MSERGEKAKTLFLSGYNCTQAVVLAFEDLIGGDRELLLKAAVPFGGGLGRQRLICGTVSGICMAAGLVYGFAEPGKGKSELYAIEQELCKSFAEREGSIVCLDLLTGKGIVTDTAAKAEQRTSEYYKKRPCPDLAKFATELLEEYILAHPVAEWKASIG